MKRIIAFVCIILAAAALAAQTHDDPIEALAQDLRTLARVTALSKDLGDTKQVMLAIVDNDVERLRGPRPDGTYDWAALQRQEASRIADEKSIEQVQTEKELRNVTVTAPNAFRVLVSVPEKRNLISANNRVYLRNVIVDSTGFDGKTTHQEIPVNAWINPGDSNGVALPEIGKSVKATAELGVESGNKKAVANVALLQAKLVDDPRAPYYPAVQRLLQIREILAARGDIQRGVLKSAVDEALLSLPGELEKRTAEQAAAIEQRKQLATSGAMKGSVAVGDATPDVVSQLTEISHLLGGTLEEQTSARTKLQGLIDALKPAAPPAQ